MECSDEVQVALAAGIGVGCRKIMYIEILN